MASFHERKDRPGTWFVKDGKGRETFSRLKYGSRAEEAARARAAEINSLAQARKAPRQAPTLMELSAGYLRVHPNLHKNTPKAIKYYMRTFCNAFKHKPATTLTHRDVTAFRAEMQAAGKAMGNQNRCLAYLKAILNWAVDQGLIYSNPWARVKRLPETRPQMTTTLADMARVLEHAAPHIRWAMGVAFYLTLRPGQSELLKLAWSAFDWEHGIVTCRQGKGGRLKRVYPKASFLWEAWPRYQADDEAGVPWVVHYRGEPIKYIYKGFVAAKERAGMEDHPIKPYDIRHLSITHMLSGGGDLAAVSAQAGHSRTSTTSDFYAHALPQAQRAAADKLPDFGVGNPSVTQSYPSGGIIDV